jgi:hypothetical protein
MNDLLFLLLITNGIISWGSDRESVKVFRIKEKVIRLISSVKIRSSFTHIFMEYRILTVDLLYILEVLYFMKKFKMNIKHNFHIHGYNTQGKSDLHTQSCHTTLFQKSVVNMDVKLYNSLPERIKTLIAFQTFKKEVKCLLLNNSFTTIQEFLQFYRS